eukprot:gnl/TRDRNA2_/TRDRNA2_36161_c0_seq1.p1 gnl/TRDRNA2_/TRDRNA2_36161_c0~~gnl/TRDRNA2_/TRDRNA2_36161_c0_seq1.p1  ORF type:complete len:731 (+),score=78.59 gnl/TRDRNA2_/TRDRNA2_36161_c0_seq1:122-2314(+)
MHVTVRSGMSTPRGFTMKRCLTPSCYLGRMRLLLVCSYVSNMVTDASWTGHSSCLEPDGSCREGDVDSLPVTELMQRVTITQLRPAVTVQSVSEDAAGLPVAPLKPSVSGEPSIRSWLLQQYKQTHSEPLQHILTAIGIMTLLFLLCTVLICSHAICSSRQRNLYLSTGTAALGFALNGYMTGVTGNVVTTGQLLCRDDWKGGIGKMSSVGYGQCYRFDDWSTGIVTALPLLGGIAASLLCIRYAESFGRRAEIRTAASLWLVGAAFLSSSPALWGIGFGALICGLGLGLSLHAAAIYVGEIAPADVRGKLVCMNNLLFVFGLFVGYLTGFLWSATDTWGWRIMVASCVPLFAAPMLVGSLFIHESPRWLLLQAAILRRQNQAAQQTPPSRVAVRRRADGVVQFSRQDPSERERQIASAKRAEAVEVYVQQARAALQFVRMSEGYEVEPELQEMRKDADISLADREVGCLQMLSHPYPVLIGCGLPLLSQLTGQPVVLLFAPTIFKAAGFSSASTLSCVAVGGVKFLASLLTMLRIDLYGRRKMLIGGTLLMALALSVLAVALSHRACDIQSVDPTDCPEDHVELPQAWRAATIIGLMLYVSGFQLGFGPATWVVMAEIFPLSIRGPASSAATLTNLTTLFAMTLCQVTLHRALSLSGLFLAYMFVSLLSVAFIWLLLPETKGKTLGEIEEEMVNDYHERVAAGESHLSSSNAAPAPSSLRHALTKSASA